MDYKTLREMVKSTLEKVFEKMEGFFRISNVDFEKGSVIANISKLTFHDHLEIHKSAQVLSQGQ